VQGIQEEAAKLIVAYSGEKARDIQQHEMEVVNAWRNLQIHLEQRKGRLADSSDLYRFFGMVRDLLNWMSDITRQMSTQEKPRYDDMWILYRSVCVCKCEWFSGVSGSAVTAQLWSLVSFVDMNVLAATRRMMLPSQLFCVTYFIAYDVMYIFKACGNVTKYTSGCLLLTLLLYEEKCQWKCDDWAVICDCVTVMCLVWSC